MTAGSSGSLRTDERRAGDDNDIIRAERIGSGIDAVVKQLGGQTAAAEIKKNILRGQRFDFNLAGGQIYFQHPAMISRNSHLLSYLFYPLNLSPLKYQKVGPQSIFPIFLYKTGGSGSTNNQPLTGQTIK